jgi:ABC-type multidrug transport system fused ATPase/permease subunit
MHFHIDKGWAVFRSLSFDRNGVIALLLIYYSFSFVGAALEGVGLASLVFFFTSGTRVDSVLPAFLTSLSGLDSRINGSDFVGQLFWVFMLLLIIRLGLLFCDGAVYAVLRRRLQSSLIRALLNGDWSRMREVRVGDAVGTVTQEALIVTKYLQSVMSFIFFIVTAAVMGGVAVAVDWRASLALAILALPLLGMMRYVFSIQAAYSREAAELRTRFAGDVTERLNGLLQVKVDGNADFHFHCATRAQARMTRLDVLIGLCQAIIGSFNILLPLMALAGIWLWSYLTSIEVSAFIASMSAVGMIGMRVSANLNNAAAALGNLSRLSGSLHPVLGSLQVPSEVIRVVVPESVTAVEVAGAGYAFNSKHVLRNISFIASVGNPILIRGSSGRGKTTLTNLLSGVYHPNHGSIFYIGSGGARFDSRSYRARIGYVTQDIYLFQGTFRENLLSGQSAEDEQVWRVLERVGAAGFVHNSGGLDSVIVEAGRSLSGGQKRRLGIARVLLSGCDILILDEITAGLDAANKEVIATLVEEVAKQYVVILVSHDDVPLSGCSVLQLD